LQEEEGVDDYLERFLANAPLAAFEQVLPLRSQQYPAWGNGSKR
jgi:hypothetical protein